MINENSLKRKPKTIKIKISDLKILIFLHLTKEEKIIGTSSNVNHKDRLQPLQK